VLVDNRDASPPQPTLSAAENKFLTETRDDEWAPQTETKIRKRFENIRGAHVEAMECRERQCKIVLAGSEGDIGQTIADLEGHRGLHGFAKNVVLTAPTKQDDGSIELAIYAVFER
jgi:hypothetical protein